MVKSVTNILPEYLIDPKRMGEVVNYLKLAPLPSGDKVAILMRWAKTVGVKISSSQRAAVAASGTDAR